MRRRFKLASSCKVVSDPPNYESHYFVMDEDISPSLHILDQSEREMCGNELYLVLLHWVSSSYRRSWKKKERKKKNLKKIGQFGLFDATRRQGLEGSEGTSIITQWRGSQLSQLWGCRKQENKDNYKCSRILKSAAILKNPWHPYI